MSDATPTSDKDKAASGAAGCFLAALAAFALLVILVMCMPVPDEETVQEQSEPTVEKTVAEADYSYPSTPEARAELRVLLDGRETLWSGLPDVPLGLCEVQPNDRNGACVTGQALFIEDYWPRAWKGEYTPRRNVAFCFQTGCDGAVMKSPIQACAWRKVILGSGDPLVDQTDVDNHDQQCGQLTASAQDAAAASAETIASRSR